MYLNCHSHFSLRWGTIAIPDLVGAVAALGVDTLALTDVNTTSGVFDFVAECHKKGLRPVVGTEFAQGDASCYVLLARNAEGFAEINRFASHYALAGKPYPPVPPDFHAVWVIYPFSVLDTSPSLRPHEFIGVRPNQVSRLWAHRRRLKADRLVVLQPVTFLGKQGYNLHRLLRAIDKNCLLSKLPPEAQAGADEYPVPPDQLAASFAAYPELLRNTERLLAGCSFDFDFKVSKNKRFFTTCQADDMDLLAKLAWDGCRWRYGEDRTAQQRVRHELRLIGELSFTAYFLMTWDLVQYAKNKGFFHVGRGSGANSVVAYCLGITNVDPIALGLYFERFINPERTSPPDFDIDFSWTDRDGVLDYLFKRYGREYVCLMATYVTFQNRGQYRELGKVFGLPKPEIDALVEGRNNRFVPGPATELDRYKALTLRYGPLLEGMPNQLSIHASGVLISEQPLFHYTALRMMPKGFPVNDFDMYVTEDVGFAKFDVLSQRGLGHIKTAVELVRQNRGERVDIHAVQDFLTDERIRRQLQAHETMGCFYIESPAMRQLIRKLRCDNYLTLVAASSIIRPGVASSGMMQAYIERHHNPASYVPVHPKMQEILAETYSVMVYQEDVLKVANQFAGLTLAEGDVLRRGMSGKYRSRVEFERIHQRFFEECRAQGYPEDVTCEVWRQIESFAGYSFSKAHSASFAVESYQSLFLKTYYPLEFITAVINNFGGFYPTEFYVHEARRCGGIVEAPDVNESLTLTRIGGVTLHLGWGLVQGLKARTIEAMLAERQAGGVFTGFDDFCARVPIGLDQLQLLVRVGGFRRFDLDKKGLLWRSELHHHAAPLAVGSGHLFAVEETHHELPVLRHHALEDFYDEWELLGFPLSSPYQWLAETPPGPVTMAADMPETVGRTVEMLGYLVTTKPTRTKQGEPMLFGYWVDPDGAFYDSVHFPKVARQYPLFGRGVYRLTGTVAVEYGHPCLTATACHRIPYRADPRSGAGDVAFESGRNP